MHVTPRKILLFMNTGKFFMIGNEKFGLALDKENIIFNLNSNLYHLFIMKSGVGKFSSIRPLNG